MKQTRHIWLIPAAVATGVVVADQLAKAAIMRLFGPDPIEGSSIPLLGQWLKFTFVKNTGVAFGMFQNFPQLFTITSILISIGAIYYYRFYLPNRHWVVQLSLGLIVGGAIGNIIDRIRLNYVIDFVHVSWFPGIFNLADSAITIGTIMLAVFILFGGDRAAPSNDDHLLNELLNQDGWSQSSDRH